MAADSSFPYVKDTESFEFWDEMPPQAKIDDMASYLQDVNTYVSSWWIIESNPTNCKLSTEFFPHHPSVRALFSE